MNFSRRQHLNELQEAEHPSADSALETFEVDGRKKVHVSKSLDGSITQQNDQLKNTVKLIQAIKALQDMKLLVEESSSEVEAILRQDEKIPGQEYKEKIHAMEKEQQSLKENEAKMSDLNDHLRTQNETLTKTNKQLKEQLATLNRCVDDERAKSIQRQGLLEQYKSDHAKLTNAYISLKDQLQTKQLQYGTLLEENHRISTELFDCKTRLEIEIKKVVQERDHALAESKERSLELEEEKGKITEQLKMLQQSKNDTDKLANEKKQIQDELVRKNEEYRNLKTELDKCKTRLSELLQSKLMSDKNPNIADLSDRNRPTKIAEMYQELYDNQWTDAYEVFHGYFKDEKRAITNLKSILEHVKGFCDDLSEDQTTRLVESLTMKTAQSGQLSPSIFKELKDIRKSLAESSLDGVLKKYIKHVEELQASGTQLATLVLDKRIRPFVESCVQICWLMSLQDPLVEIGTDPDPTKPINTNIYKFYSQTGIYVDYVVWPALLLHKEGPPLCKGVLQGHTPEVKRYTPVKGDTPVVKRDATVVQSYTPQDDKPLSRERRRGNFVSRLTSLGPVIMTNVNPQLRVHINHSDDRQTSHNDHEYQAKENTCRPRETNIHETTSSSISNSKTEQTEDATSDKQFTNENDLRKFCRLGRQYGLGSKEQKDALGDRYQACLEDYNKYIK